MSDGIARFKDFTEHQTKIQFSVRGEMFTAKDDIPLPYLGRLSELGSGLGDSGEDATAKILKVFEAMLDKQSYEKFEQAISGDGEIVIGITLIQQIITWLLEQYGLRPTEPSSGSGITLSESGGNSTAGAVPEELTLVTSAQ